MAMYRIKNDDQPPQLPEENYPPEEYWREVKPGQERDLDLEEIAELNRSIPEEDELADEEAIPLRPFRSPWLKALLALAVIVAFILWVSADMFSGYIDFSFLKRSSQLSRDDSLAALRSAVVSVESSGGSGSGFNIAADGLIVTNRHVVEDGGIILVKLADGSSYASRDHVEIPGVDLALIDIDGEDLPCVELGHADPEQGEELIFIGNPLGFDWTISEAVTRGMVLIDDRPSIWFDGPVQAGSSGSPLFNAEAQVIGVVYARLIDVENSGLAIPISYLISFLEEEHER